VTIWPKLRNRKREWFVNGKRGSHAATADHFRSEFDVRSSRTRACPSVVTVATRYLSPYVNWNVINRYAISRLNAYNTATHDVYYIKRGTFSFHD